MKRQTKAAIRDILKAGGVTFWIFVAVICLIVVNYGDENSDNTYTISGIVTDVKLHYSRNTRLVEFKINGIQCYYKLYDREYGATMGAGYSIISTLVKGQIITNNNSDQGRDNTTIKKRGKHCAGNQGRNRSRKSPCIMPTALR